MTSTSLKTILPPTLVGLVLLGALTVFGYTGHLSAADTYTGLLAFIGLVGASGIYVLASNLTNAAAVPHLIVGIAVVGALIALGLHNVFASAQIVAILGLLLTGTAATVGTVQATASARVGGPK